MLRATRKASEIASSFVDDGDDLHITSSFRASDDNSSIIGNASCMESLPPVPIKILKNDSEDDDSTDSAVSTIGVSQVEGREDESTDDRNKFKLLRQLSFKRRLSQAKKLLPWRLSTFVAVPRPSRAIREYQEMVEHDGVSPTASDAASYAGTMHSLRSSRINVATGRALLVRQNAQVINRPSAAKTDWDIGSKLSSKSSSGSSSNGGSSRSRIRSLSWDNASFGARSEISHLTGDSFRSKRSDYSTSRAMYLHPEPFLLGTTDEEDEQENETGNENYAPQSDFNAVAKDFELRLENSSVDFGNKSGLDRPGMQPSNPKDVGFESEARRAVRRLLQTQEKTNFSELSTLDLFASRSSDGSSPKEQVRARVYSDSDFVFEMHRQRASMDGCVDEFGFHVPAPNTNKFEAPQIERHLPFDFDPDAMRSRSYSDSLVAECVLREGGLTSLTTATRFRSFSENQVFYSDEEGGVDFLDGFDFVKSTASIEHVEISSFALMSPSNDGREKSQPIEPIKFWSDHTAKSRNYERRLSNPETIRHKSSFEVLLPVGWRRLGASDAFKDSQDGTSYKPQEPIETAVVARGSNLIQRTGDPRRSLPSSQRLSSPTAISAAKVIASALRPPTAASALRPPTANTLCPPTVSKVDYYWNNGSDGESDADEVLWALSSDDSFEDMF